MCMTVLHSSKSFETHIQLGCRHKHRSYVYTWWGCLNDISLWNAFSLNYYVTIKHSVHTVSVNTAFRNAGWVDSEQTINILFELPTNYMKIVYYKRLLLVITCVEIFYSFVWISPNECRWQSTWRIHCMDYTCTCIEFICMYVRAYV